MKQSAMLFGFSIIMPFIAARHLRHRFWPSPAYFVPPRVKQETYFENSTDRRVIAQLGGNALLNCRVHHLNGQPLSWVRMRDFHILSTGLYTYTNDDRFEVYHADGSDLWTLEIRRIRKRDHGHYQCQIATGTGILKFQVKLIVMVPEAYIEEGAEYHVEVGSTINLLCVIKNSAIPPAYVIWYRGSSQVNYGVVRGGVGVTSEYGFNTTSRLVVRNAMYSDSGNYTCAAPHIKPASITVFVSQGEDIAAIQRKNSCSIPSLPCSVTWTLLLTYYYLVMR